jgi:hypothetical protein
MATNTPITLYDATGYQWTPRIAEDVNPVLAKQYLVYNIASGLLVLNDADQENAGGLVSADCPLPPSTIYFGLDVAWTATADDLPHTARNEMDLKITTADGSAKALPNQANGSCQWNATTKTWELDPTGTGWVDSGFAQAPVVGANLFQSRFWTDGEKWTVTGLRLNGGEVFVAGEEFQDVGMVTSNWTVGLHPQLQLEAQDVPFFLRCLYSRVWVMAGSAALPW